MTVRKLNKKKLGIFCGVILVLLVVLIVFICNLVSEAKLRKTAEYRLGEVGYSSNEVSAITKYLSKEQVEDIIKAKYKKDLTKFIKEKYFVYDNLERYLSYYSENEEVDASKVISIVNVNADTEWYSDIKNTDTSLNELMLVNKFYKLEEGYVPEDLTEVSVMYSYDGNYVSELLYDDLINMLDKAKKDGYTLVVSQGYRSYKDQADIYKSIEDSSSKESADIVAARAGHSEYQTGLSVRILPYNKSEDSIDIKTSAEYKWLSENAYKYGFVLRYPENTTDITGFESDNWRYRYVGKDAAKVIHEDNITFDEYYSYYVSKGD